MTTFRLLLRSALYHWRGNLAVLLGMALGTAVLTGALFVGDSLRGSLRNLALDQLGWVDNALIANRFFGADLTDQVKAQHKAPALLLQGSIREVGKEETNHVAGITLLGVTSEFWMDRDTYQPALPPGTDEIFWQGKAASIVLNESLAQDLNVAKGSRVELLLTRTDEMPRESLLGKRAAQDVLKSIRVNVHAVIPDVGMAKFSLKPSPQTPRNAFLPLGFVSKEMGLTGKINVILAATPKNQVRPRLSDWGYSITLPQQRAEEWRAFLSDQPKKERLSDEVIRKLTESYPGSHPYLNLQGTRGVIERPLEKVVRNIAQMPGSAASRKWRGLPVLVYLADTIQSGKAEVPYAVVAAVPGVPDPADPAKLLPIKGNEVYLVSYPDSPFDKDVSTLDIRYFVPDSRNELEKKSETFQVKGILPLSGPLDDPYWTPPFPGITNKLTIEQWDPLPFIDLSRVRKYDLAAFKVLKRKPLEVYWARHKTTPRAYISLEKGQELWGTRFGQLSSVRLHPQDGTESMEEAARRLEAELLEQLPPDAGGFTFQDVRTQVLQAGGGSMDFGVLFLAFSFFLILATLLLVGLLIRLNMERRAQEMGVLLATGWSHRQVRRLLIGEGMMLTAIGALFGLSVAFFYTALLLEYLRVNWPGGEGLTFLQLHTSWQSVGIGWAGSLGAGFLTLVWATRTLSKLPPKTLLSGAPAFTQTQNEKGRRWSDWVIWGSLLGACGCFIAGWFVEGHEAKAGSFFGCGALALTAGLAFLWQRLGAESHASGPQPNLTRLGIRNASRYRLRSVLTIGLLASATFMVTGVESFHKNAGDEFYQKDQGSGGFVLAAETDVPIFKDLNEKSTRVQLDIRKEHQLAWDLATFYAFRMRGGDDTSCLNLYQPLQPRLLGANKAFRQRGGFSFASTLAETSEEKANPWLLLEKSQKDGSIPVFADATSAMWVLKAGLGDIVEVATPSASTIEESAKIKLRIVGLLRESIFQSELILADEAFTRTFPHEEGFRFFLIECPLEKADEVKKALQATLADHGFRVQTTRERVQSYLAVENTYLATFQALGGLGLLLGAVGLAIVLLRGVWERRAELALLQALGFRKSALAWLVLVENLFLLVLGLTLGTLAALLAVAPHLLQFGASAAWVRVILLLGIVAAIGLVSGTLAVAASLRTPILTALRRE